MTKKNPYIARLDELANSGQITHREYEKAIKEYREIYKSECKPSTAKQLRISERQ